MNCVTLDIVALWEVGLTMISRVFSLDLLFQGYSLFPITLVCAFLVSHHLFHRGLSHDFRAFGF